MIGEENAPESGSQPMWSVMIPSHNPNHYILEALRSVLEQAPGPDQMQIEVLIDGHIADAWVARIKDVAGDRVSIFLHGEAVGQARNLNAAIQRARGRWIHLLHHDDLILPGFYASLWESLESTPGLGAAYTRHAFIDEDGHWTRLSHLERRSAGIPEGLLERMAAYSRIQTPSIVVRKEVYEEIGGFREDLIFALDWEMWVRIACQYPIWFEPRILALYRVNSEGLSSSLRRSGNDMRDTKKAIEIMARYLPSAMRKGVRARASRFYAHSAILMAREFYKKGDSAGALNQIRAGLEMSCDPSVLKELSRVQLGRLRRWLALSEKNPVTGRRRN